MDPNAPPPVSATLTPLPASIHTPTDAGPPKDTPPQPVRGSGMQRAVLTAAVSAMLLIGGAVAVVSAASPEPSTSTSPSVTDPSVDGTAPSTAPDRPAGGTKADCPNDGSGGSNGSGGSSTAPDSSASPDTTTDPSPAATRLS